MTICSQEAKRREEEANAETEAAKRSARKRPTRRWCVSTFVSIRAIRLTARVFCFQALIREAQERSAEAARRSLAEAEAAEAEAIERLKDAEADSKVKADSVVEKESPSSGKSEEKSAEKSPAKRSLKSSLGRLRRLRRLRNVVRASGDRTSAPRVPHRPRTHSAEASCDWIF